jgi:hypothetical protein
MTLLLTVSAAAQAPSPASRPTTPEFLSNYHFHLAAAKLSGDDQRFSWDTHFGGDLDLIDYVSGRLNIVADYNAVLGSEFRAFDPNQGNYTLEASLSGRAGATEIAAVFHHVSRHLSDRSKRLAIDWNIVGVRVLRQMDAAGWAIDTQAFGGGATKHDYVDYTWTGSVDVQLRRPIRERLGAFVHGTGELFGVDPRIAGRDAQAGGRLEGGVRISGRAAVVELFVGLERRVDAYPLDRAAQRWAMAGFRLVSQ